MSSAAFHVPATSPPQASHSMSSVALPVPALRPSPGGQFRHGRHNNKAASESLLSHRAPDQPLLHSHTAPVHAVLLQEASQVPWPLQCCVFEPLALLHAQRPQASSQSFHIR